MTPSRRFPHRGVFDSGCRMHGRYAGWVIIVCFFAVVAGFIAGLPPDHWFKEKYITPGWMTAVATLLLFLITCLLGLLAYRQDKTSRAQLRAYLFAEDPRIQEGGAMGYPTAKLWIKNFGQTPAYGVAIKHFISFNHYPIPTLEDMPKPDEISRTNLGPGQRLRIEISMEEALTSPEYDAIYQGRAAIYVFAVVQFTDAFDCQWRSTIRLMHTHRNLGTDELEVCSEGNETRQL